MNSDLVLRVPVVPPMPVLGTCWLYGHGTSLTPKCLHVRDENCVDWTAQP